MGKDSLFKKWCRKKVDIYMQNMNLNPCLTQCIRINLTWSIDLNVRTVTIKLLDKKRRSNLGIDKNFLGQKKHEPLKKSDKLDFTEMKIFCSSKDLLSWKSKPWTGRKYLWNVHLIKTIPKCIKNSYKSF